MRQPKKNKKFRCRPCHKKFGTDYAKFLSHRRKHHSEAVSKAKETSNRNNYGQSAAEYDAQLEKQHNRCICGRKAKNVALHQDHRHKIAKLKVINEKVGDWWVARNEEYAYVYRSHNRKKAKRMIQLKLKRRSRRGVLCWHCNAALKKLQDNWKIARLLSQYLKYWDEEQEWDSVKEECIHGKH